MKKLILFSIFIIYVIQPSYAQEDIIPIESSGTFLGAKAKGIMTVRYCSINPGDDNLRRPLIVAEGYDYGEILSPEEPFGETDIPTGLPFIFTPNRLKHEHTIPGSS